MACNDWKKDGKNDFQDNYIEYHIYHDSTVQNSNSHHTYVSGVSTAVAIISVIGGLFLAALIVALFAGENVENVPVLITIILWVVCSAVLSVFFECK